MFFRLLPGLKFQLKGAVYENVVDRETPKIQLPIYNGAHRYYPGSLCSCSGYGRERRLHERLAFKL